MNNVAIWNLQLSDVTSYALKWPYLEYALLDKDETGVIRREIKFRFFQGATSLCFDEKQLFVYITKRFVYIGKR